jgi:hypothetical protein
MKHLITILIVLAFAGCTTTTVQFPDGRTETTRTIATDAIIQIAPVVVTGVTTIADIVRQIREAEAAQDEAKTAEERAQWQAKIDALRGVLNTLRGGANADDGKIVVPDMFTAGFNG